MRILIIENNLMWSSRLKRSIAGFGHTALVSPDVPSEADGAQIAIVNLGTTSIDAVKKLQAMGIYVIGHAGHKETEKLEFGREAGCNRLVSNSQLTYKIEELLNDAMSSHSSEA